jgi:hypothetical protein
MAAENAFSCELSWHGRRAFFIWLSNDHDCVVLDSAGSIRLFDSLESLSQFVLAEGLTLSEEESSFWDFDNVLTWCTDPHPPVDCSHLLDAWNMLADIHASRGKTNDLLSNADQRGGAIYEKLFWAAIFRRLLPKVRSSSPYGQWRNAGALLSCCDLDSPSWMLLYHHDRRRADAQMEPTRLTVRAIMSSRRAAHLQR